MRFLKGSTEVRSIGYRGLCLVIIVLSVAQLAFGDRKNTENAPAIPSGKESENFKPSIRNFGRVGDHFFRGAQPRPEDYPALARLGVKTIIDLRDDPEKYAEECASKAGLKYIGLPMSDRDYPQDGSAEKFLSIVTDGANWPVFVHCAGGRHRTGVMTAVYRMTVEGWDIDRAYREMKDYDFYTRWGHKAMKDFVFDYSTKLKEKRKPQVARTEPQAVTTESAQPDKP